MKNCQKCSSRGEVFVGCCYVPWCEERDEPISFPETESCLRLERTQRVITTTYNFQSGLFFSIIVDNSPLGSAFAKVKAKKAGIPFEEPKSEKEKLREDAIASAHRVILEHRCKI